MHDDILQLESNATKLSDLSSEEQDNLQLATDNLIQTILAHKTDKNRQQSEDVKKESKQSSHSQIAPNDHPKCVTAQPSFVINSPMPRVPTRSIVIAIDEGDTKSYDHFSSTSQHLITMNKQFENILEPNKHKSDNSLILNNSTLYNNEQTDWAYYSSKPDLFSPTLHSNLPIIQSEDQHLSLRQTFLSHIHRRPKFPAGANPATFHSSSLNASDYIQSSFTSAQIFVNDAASFQQRIFRVRKNRIIISFDDLRRETNGKIYFRYSLPIVSP